MKSHNLLALRDLVVDGVNVAKGAKLGELATDLNVERVVAGLGNGNVVVEALPEVAAVVPPAEVKAKTK